MRLTAAGINFAVRTEVLLWNMIVLRSKKLGTRGCMMKEYIKETTIPKLIEALRDFGKEEIEDAGKLLNS